MKKNNTPHLLFDDAYKCVRMGSYAIYCIIEKIKEASFYDLVEKQNEYYLSATNALDDYAKRINYQPKDINAMLKTSSFLSINANTAFNKETSHIAEMLIEGTTMGITTLIKELKENDNADEEIKDISSRLIANMEEFIESLKEFL